jgi:hypothetical protein
MVVIVPPVIVEAPQPLGRRPSLITSAVGPLDLTSPHGLGGGVQFTETSCGLAYPYPINCDEGDKPEKPLDPGNPSPVFPSFAVLAGIECASVGYTAAEYDSMIRRRLENGEAWAAEYALWHGTAPDGTDLGIPNLNENVTEVDSIVAYDPEHLGSVVSALEQWMYGTQGYGFAAFIHAPVGVAAWGNSFGELVIRDGTRYRTPAGSVWVFGGGYDADDGLRITGTTTVYRAAEPFVWPVHEASLNRETNQLHLLAEREYAVTFECGVGSADFNPLGGS